MNHPTMSERSYHGATSLSRETGGSRTESCLGNRVGATIPRIHSLSKPLLQPVHFKEQVYCDEAKGVWLKHITPTVNHQSKKHIIYRLSFSFCLVPIIILYLYFATGIFAVRTSW